MAFEDSINYFMKPRRIVALTALAVLLVSLIVSVHADYGQFFAPQVIEAGSSDESVLSTSGTYPALAGTWAPPDLSPPDASVIVPAFVGASGFGSDTPGGRFGRVVMVTNLNDTTDEGDPAYLGSLRWALEHTWLDDPADPYDHRRVIVFKVGGIIDLADVLYVKNPYVTIAGQTAPGDGIVLRGGQVTIATHDVIVRGLRFRVGDEGVPTCCRDGLNISTSHAKSDIYGIVVDHNSFSWAIDENVSIYQDDERPYAIHDITIQWNIISEGLNDSIHVDEGAAEADPHSMGMILGSGSHNVTVHHNLFAHNWGRNPRVAGVINSEILNNVMYAWDDAALEFGHDKSFTHVINNYFKASGDSRPAEIKLSDSMHPESRIYLLGNVGDDYREGASLIPVRFKDAEGFAFAETPIFHSEAVVDSPEIAFEAVLDHAGAITPSRDAVDLRIIDQVLTGAGTIIDSQDQVGGWPKFIGGAYPADGDHDGIPDGWEILHGLNPDDAGDASNFQKLAPGGYTWIEEYINSLIPMVSYQ